MRTWVCDVYFGFVSSFFFGALVQRNPSLTNSWPVVGIRLEHFVCAPGGVMWFVFLFGALVYRHPSLTNSCMSDRIRLEQVQHSEHMFGVFVFCCVFGRAIVVGRMLRNSAFRVEIRTSGSDFDQNQNRPVRPTLGDGRRARALPMRIRPKSGPNTRFLARAHYCVTYG